MYLRILRRGLFLFSLIVLAGVGILSRNYFPAHDAKIEVATPPPATSNSIEMKLLAYQQELQRKDLSIGRRAQLESLIAEMSNLATMKAATKPPKYLVETSIAKNPARWTQMALLTSPYPTETLELGILVSGQLFQTHETTQLIVINIWQGFVDGKLVRVLAGKLMPSPESPKPYRITNYGALFIRSNDSSMDRKFVVTDEERGELRILMFKDDKLLLISSGTKSLAAKKYLFNLRTLSFENLPDE